jgi:SAM-dependent methyltransferase
VSGADGPGRSDTGHAVYSKSFLRIYDPLVLGFFGRFVWRCPTDRLVDQYRALLGDRHLDIGPGTGYLLDAAAAAGSITLLDPNPNVLSHCMARFADLHPTAIQADILQPLPDIGSFDSVALNYVLHCLPSDGDLKARAVANAAAVLDDGGVLFGATVLGTPELQTAVSRRALAANNRRGIFDNATDDLETIRSALGRSFHDFTVEMVGSVAVFSAHRRKPL